VGELGQRTLRTAIGSSKAVKLQHAFGPFAGGGEKGSATRLVIPNACASTVEYYGRAALGLTTVEAESAQLLQTA
jgi:hypothetical protein